MAYIDTSVLVAYYCPERFSGAAQRAVKRVKEPAISPLVEVELYSAVALKVRTRELDAATARRIIAPLQEHVASGYYKIVPIEAREYRLARDWIGRFSVPLRGPGALHLAAAFANGLVLVTADKNLARSAKHFGVKHKLVS